MKKMYYSISEVGTMLGLAPHVLRYWETEFPWLRPRKNRAGARVYRDSDIEMIREIQELLYVQRFTVEGARLEMERRRKEDHQVTSVGTSERQGEGHTEATIPQLKSEQVDPELPIARKTPPPGILAHIKTTLYEILDLLD